MTNVVYGVYQFLGFHICSYLLENGQEVAGYDWEANAEEAEEKQLMIGRNANYSYCDEQWTAHDEVKLYLCLYDYLGNPFFSESRMEQLTENIDVFLSKLPKKAIEMIVFLPEQLQDHFRCIISDWKIKINQDYQVRFLYLTELYGPWLPPDHSLMSSLQKEKTVLKANMSKYIYIDDFLRSWEEIMALSEKEIYIAGEQDERWTHDLPAYILEAKTSLTEGMQLIEEHNEKIEILRKRF